jgi:hypothetical protein
VAAPDRALPSILSVIDRRHAPAGASLGAELPGPRIIAPSVVAPTRMPAIPAVLAAPPPVAPEVRLTSESVASPEVSFASEPIALPEVTIEVESGAVPEPIALEVSVPTERMVVTPSFAPEPVEPLRAPSAAPAPWSIDSELHLDSLPPASAPRVETPSPAAAPARPRQRRSASFSDADAAFFAAGEQMERGEVDGFDDVDDPVPSLRPQPLWRRITGRHRAG